MEYVHCMDRKKMDEVISAIKDLKGKKWTKKYSTELMKILG
jgi:hypothetical protein